MSRPSALRARIGCLIAAVLLLGLCAPASHPQPRWQVPVIRLAPMSGVVTPLLQNPAVNIPAVPAYSSTCQNNPMGSACETASIAALNNARTLMGLPAYVLPTNFTSLGALDQLLALSNADRAVYGLSSIVGFNATLNAAAQVGISQDTDPIGPSTVDGVGFRAWGSNWAAGWSSPLYTYYEWMYDDGPGGTNIDCTVTDLSGCWGHRDNTLTNFGSNLVAMGAATGASPRYHSTAFTELYEAFPAGSAITLAASGSGTGAFSPANVSAGPAISVPTTLSATNSCTISGTGFPANDAIHVVMTDSHGTAENFGNIVTTGSAGTFSVTGTVPNGIFAGRVTVTAVQTTNSTVLATATTQLPGISVTPPTTYAVPNFAFSVDVHNAVAGAFRLTADGTTNVTVLSSSPDGSGGVYVAFFTPVLAAGAHTLTVDDISPPPGGQVSSSATVSFTVTAPWIAVYEINPAANEVDTFPFGFPNNDPLEIGYFQNSTFHLIATTTSHATGGASDRVPLNQFPAGPTTTLTYLDPTTQQSISTILSHTGVLKPDLLATSTAGGLWRYPDNGTSTPYVVPQVIGTGGWQNFNHIVAGDVNGDGLTDLIATTVDGRLFYYQNNGTATPYVVPQVIGTGGWQNFTHITIGDVDGDGKADLIATTADGRLFYYRNNGTSTPYVVAQVTGTTGWQNFGQVMLGDFDGDGRADLIGITPAGGMFYYENTSPNLGPVTTPFPTVQYLGGGWQNFDHIALSDANGDGAVDILASAGGRLFYYPSRHGYLAPTSSATVIGTAGWQNFNQII